MAVSCESDMLPRILIADDQPDLLDALTLQDDATLMVLAADLG